MTQTLIHSSTGLRTLAILSGLMLGSCQTNAGDILATGSIDAAAQTAPSPEAGYSDPHVVAVAAASGAKAGELPLTEPPASLKRKPVPLAAAYSDIAEPPPEVLALQQQAAAGQAASQDLGAMQPTEVNSGKNSLFSTRQAQPPVPAPTDAESAPSQAVASASEPVTSLVPGNMPTLGVNAMSKSLFSPSAEQQQMLPTQEQAAAPVATAPFVVPDIGPPKLHKLSDPRPKRKMLALREPIATVTAAVPQRVQLTPAQLQTMDAVPETSADSATLAAATPDDSAAPKPKKKWLPSLSELMKGGTKPKSAAP
jgi:hypothetical protein